MSAKLQKGLFDCEQHEAERHLSELTP